MSGDAEHSFDLDLESAINAGKDLTRTHEHDGYKPVITHPQGTEVTALVRDKMERPLFLEDRPSFLAIDSFIDYVNDFKDESSRVFVGEKTIRCYLDYHENAKKPRHHQHFATFCATVSDEWKVWTDHNTDRFTQVDFAEFIEDHAKDFMTPNAQEMLNVATTLQAKKDVEFKGNMKLENGSMEMGYTESVSGVAGGGNIAIPTEFTLALRPFKGLDRYEIKARFRYRIGGGALKIFYKLLETDLVQEKCMEEMAEKVAEKTNLPVHIGEL